MTSINPINFLKLSKMTREYSYTITKKQHDYLLPIFGRIAKNKLIERYHSRKKITTYLFIGSEEGYKDMLLRCRYLS